MQRKQYRLNSGNDTEKRKRRKKNESRVKGGCSVMRFKLELSI